ncbi:hypothetical protein [Roseovarius sp. A-2]|uniref:hypothetical protein n=1 Tax=Roseovarius sp. A-2 TaxID=1570360 RepID=UPI001592F3F0|nr:hypothetical protein [Roseovarius sp. A-2]
MLEWVHRFADTLGWAMSKADFLPIGIGKGLLFLLTLWLIASALFIFSYIRYRIFGGEPPDDFAYYSVPSFFIILLMGGILAINLFTR